MMSRPVTHIIHKLNLEIDVPDEKLARKMYQQAGSLLQQYVLPKLEELLKELDDNSLHIRLDKLDVNIDALQTAVLEDVIKMRIAEAIKDQLVVVIGKEKKSVDTERSLTKTGPQLTIDAFLWFISHGALPWWFADREELSGSTSIIEAIAQAESGFIPVFLKALQSHNRALDRLLLQYDTVLLTYLFSLLAPLEIFSEATNEERYLLSKAEGKFDTEQLKLRYWQEVWLVCPIAELAQSSPLMFQRQLRKWLDKLLDVDPGKAERASLTWDVPILNPDIADEVMSLEKMAEVKDGSQDKDNDLPENGLLATHAGLVLLHPFLQYFFTELKLIEGETFRDNRCRETAAHILHYLATGRENAADFDLLFEKYLCGLTANDITHRYIQITNEMKTEADSMLASVIKHWSALKNTSPDALRESFLQRNGKLIALDGSHRIVMEQSTLDILLMHIPWNISLIKLPWLQHLIHVEWGI